MIDIKNIKFSRFGGLSSVKQKGYSKDMEGFHSPPCKRGIYAFIWTLYEPFLLGGTYSNILSKHSKFEYVKDKNGNSIEYNENDYDFDSNFMKKYSTHKKNGKEYWIKPIKPKNFTYTGEIWHHLEPKNRIGVLKTKGTWFLTDYKTYIKCLHIEYKNFKKQNREIFGENNNRKGFQNMNITIDHLEVFIEKI